MMGGDRHRADEPIEVLSGDPQLFGTAPAAPPPAPDQGPRLTIAIASLIALVIALVIAWPRSSEPSTSTPSTSTPSTSTTQPDVAPGREAPTPSARVPFSLKVVPTPVALDASVTMQLTGDLSRVAPRLSAVAWVDRQVTGGWETIQWLARSSTTSQTGAGVSDGGFAPGPDAITYAAGDPVRFDMYALPAGRYRLCRYVPLLSTGTTVPPASNPAYVCAPLVVGA